MMRKMTINTMTKMMTVNSRRSILRITNAELMRDDDDREDNDDQDEEYADDYHRSMFCVANAA